MKNYPRGNEHNAVCDVDLLKDWCVEKSSIEHAMHTSRIEENAKMLLFKFDVSTSVKSTVANSTVSTENKLSDFHAAYLAFDIETKELLFYSFSSCSCCYGRHFWSHLTGCVLFTCSTQGSHLTFEEFEMLMTYNPVNLKNSITLIESFLWMEPFLV